LIFIAACVVIIYRTRKLAKEKMMLAAAAAASVTSPSTFVPLPLKDSSSKPPPAYGIVTQAEPAYFYPLYNGASGDGYQAALNFTRNNPIMAPLPPDAVVPPWKTFNFYQTMPASLMTSIGVEITGNTIKFTQKRDLCLQSAYPVPLYGPPDEIYYYQVRIIAKAAKTVIAVGFATRPYPGFRLPGWDPISIGYHSDDGRKFISDAFGGRDYAIAYGKGDVIGVGVRPRDGLVFFTRNGVDLGIAAVAFGVGQGLYPTIGMDGEGEVKIDFESSFTEHHY